MSKWGHGWIVGFNEEKKFSKIWIDPSALFFPANGSETINERWWFQKIGEWVRVIALKLNVRDLDLFTSAEHDKWNTKANTGKSLNDAAFFGTGFSSQILLGDSTATFLFGRNELFPFEDEVVFVNTWFIGPCSAVAEKLSIHKLRVSTICTDSVRRRKKYEQQRTQWPRFPFCRCACVTRGPYALKNESITQNATDKHERGSCLFPAIEPSVTATSDGLPGH